MANFFLIQIVWLAILATFVFAIWKGGQAERWAGSLVVAGAIFAFAMHKIVPADLLPTALLGGEFLLALGFLTLAVRFASLWLGAAMLLQAVQFMLHAWYLLSERPRDTFYSMVNNVDTIGILICIIVGTATAWRRRSAAEASASGASGGESPGATDL
ncbi:MAG: hypothetical protein KF842_08945 [Caulobacter sp.]|nr:hypothetical protein [Caulobacter sp.]